MQREKKEGKNKKKIVQAVNNQSKQRDKRFGGAGGRWKRADKVPAAKAKTHCECEYSWNFHLLSTVAWGCIVRNVFSPNKKTKKKNCSQTKPNHSKLKPPFPPTVNVICRFVLLLPLQLSLHFCNKSVAKYVDRKCYANFTAYKMKFTCNFAQCVCLVLPEKLWWPAFKNCKSI